MRPVHGSTLAAIAAKKYIFPGRMIFSRSEDMIQSGQQHPFLNKWQVALGSYHEFIGLEVRLFVNAGYSMDLTKGVR